jgi:uncharacterized membrane protein YkvA (DUF1232 family)
MTLRERAGLVVRFLPDCVVLIRRLVAMPETSRLQTLTIALLVPYLLSPIDLVPDFIPVVGQLDDAILVALALGWLLRTHGEEAVREAWPGPKASLGLVLRAAGGSRPAATL